VIARRPGSRSHVIGARGAMRKSADFGPLFADSVSGPYRRMPTRRSIAHRLVRLVRIGWLRWKIHANDEWITIHERQGIHGTANLREIELETQAMRVELAVLETS
jgi:hypothetical protein